ncbi:MAG: hypothetical protein WCA00_14115 [Candidatus Acidiferrales bacterium]
MAAAPGYFAELAHTDPANNPMIPQVFVLEPGLISYKITMAASEAIGQRLEAARRPSSAVSINE